MQAGSTVGAYRVVAALGSGGMGEVYRAHDDRLGRDVALKILPADVATNPERLARFRREARSVAALNHPHIVTIFSIEEANGVPFMTMELVEGRSLEHALAGGGLPLDQFFDIGVALADALSAAHRKGIVHRDVKPANVMITDASLVKVLDFGLARDTSAHAPSEYDATALGLTQAGIIVGTVPYMSPEQIEGRTVDHRSDIFSLGIVLYEMASGTRPFEADSTAGLMSSILRDSPRPLTEIRAEVPEGVWRLAARCLEKSPGDRAQSAQDIHAELRDLRRAWESGASRLAGSAGRSTTPPRSTSSAIRSPAADRVASIAVMPFADLSPGGDQEWFCDGIAEEILNALTALENLRVAARASAFSLRGRSDDLKTIGEKLRVTTVLGGSVRRSGDRVRMTVQLSEVETGFQLWSERYDREVNDIFEIQDGIATAVAERLKVTLADGPLDRLARLVERGTTNIDAYQLYLQGRALLTRRGTGMGRALELFQQAVALDPNYSVAWAAIAETHTALAYLGIVRGAESKSHAIAAATRAIELSPASAAGHAALGCAVLAYSNDRSRARRAFDRALELNPHDVQGRCWYALFYLQWVAGEFDRGLAHARRALDDDPLSEYVTMIVAACLATAGRLDEAIDMGRLAIERDPQSYVARWQHGVVLVEAGRLDEAIALLETAPEQVANTLELISLAFAYQRAGRVAGAAAVHHRVLGRAAERYVPRAYLALSAAAAGLPDDAIACARAAWEDREPPFLLFARHHPQWRPLHADPRFQSILREMNAGADEPS